MPRLDSTARLIASVCSSSRRRLNCPGPGTIARSNWRRVPEPGSRRIHAWRDSVRHPPCPRQPAHAPGSRTPPVRLPARVRPAGPGWLTSPSISPRSQSKRSRRSTILRVCHLQADRRLRVLAHVFGDDQGRQVVADGQRRPNSQRGQAAAARDRTRSPRAWSSSCPASGSTRPDKIQAQRLADAVEQRQSNCVRVRPMHCSPPIATCTECSAARETFCSRAMATKISSWRRLSFISIQSAKQ